MKITDNSGMTLIEFLLATFLLFLASLALASIAAEVRKSKVSVSLLFNSQQLRMNIITVLTNSEVWNKTFNAPENTGVGGSFKCLIDGEPIASCNSGGPFVIRDGANNIFFDPSSSSDGFTDSLISCDYSSGTPNNRCPYSLQLSWDRPYTNMIRLKVELLFNPETKTPLNINAWSFLILKSF